MAKIDVEVEGKKIVGEEVGFRIVDDGTLRVELDDGAVLRVKPVLVAAFKTDEKNAEGERLYVLQHLVRVVVEKASEGDQQ